MPALKLPISNWWPTRNTPSQLRWPSARSPAVPMSSKGGTGRGFDTPMIWLRHTSLPPFDCRVTRLSSETRGVGSRSSANDWEGRDEAILSVLDDLSTQGGTCGHCLNPPFVEVLALSFCSCCRSRNTWRDSAGPFSWRWKGMGSRKLYIHEAGTKSCIVQNSILLNETFLWQGYVHANISEPTRAFWVFSRLLSPDATRQETTWYRKINYWNAREVGGS
jgi:hypothetical protein